MAEPRRANGASRAPAKITMISGIEAMRGVGAGRAKSFWADAWERVLGTRTAVVAIAWIAAVALLAVLAPVIANAQPLWLEPLTPASGVASGYSPLWRSLSAADLLLLIGAPAALLAVFAPLPGLRSHRTAAVVGVSVLAMFAVAAVLVAFRWIDDAGRAAWVLEWRDWIRDASLPWRRVVVALIVSAPIGALFMLVPFARRWWVRLALVAVTILAASTVVGHRLTIRPPNYDALLAAERRGEIRTTPTLIPWSPDRARSELISVPPWTTVGEAFAERIGRLAKERDRRAAAGAAAQAAGRAMDAQRSEDDARQVERQRTQLEAEWKRIEGTPFASRRFILGTDPNGVDVLSQLIWACRLSLSVGFVSTGIALLIGVTLGALMGYFGGWVDLLLFRVVEVFMAMPVLFLLIVAAGVLPRNTYVMMAIIGCVSWTGAARFTRAEFMKLRNQDFVQSCRAVGLPLRSILFRHMLPNGVTPVLVDASFAIAAAILAEATLSYLGLGPDDQASWGKLLANATSTTGTFVWWLAIFPGLVIFLSVLAYNVLGGALRDAIDPKLRKAAH